MHIKYLEYAMTKTVQQIQFLVTKGFFFKNEPPTEHYIQFSRMLTRTILSKVL